VSDICLLSEIEAHRWRFNHGQLPPGPDNCKHIRVSKADAKRMISQGLAESQFFYGQEHLLPQNIKKRIGRKRSDGYLVLQALND
jgi:hypothetical protein